MYSQLTRCRIFELGHVTVSCQAARNHSYVFLFLQNTPLTCLERRTLTINVGKSLTRRSFVDGSDCLSVVVVCVM